MDRDETVKLLGLVRAVYPSFHAGAAKSDVEAVVAAWQMMFGEEPFPLVQAALKAFIASDVKGFPPAIGQIKEQLIRLGEGEAGEMTETQAWALVQRALRNGIYGYRTEYARLPETIQRCLGTPMMLHEWAQMDVDTVNSVVASNFMRSYRARAAHVREMRKLPPDVKALYAAVGDAFRWRGAGRAKALEAGRPGDQEVRETGRPRARGAGSRPPGCRSSGARWRPTPGSTTRRLPGPGERPCWEGRAMWERVKGRHEDNTVWRAMNPARQGLPGGIPAAEAAPQAGADRLRRPLRATSSSQPPGCRVPAAGRHGGQRRAPGGRGGGLAQIIAHIDECLAARLACWSAWGRAPQADPHLPLHPGLELGGHRPQAALRAVHDLQAPRGGFEAFRGEMGKEGGRTRAAAGKPADRPADSQGRPSRIYKAPS